MDNILNQRVVLFGAGGVGLMALDYFGLERVECFVDNNKEKAGTVLCGKTIVSFDDLLKRFANKEGFRIYLTTDTYFNQLAEQLNENGVYNYTFYRDFIPDYEQVKKLIIERVDKTKRLAIIGTNNASELVLSAVVESGLEPNVVGVFDNDSSKNISNYFYLSNVKPLSELQVALEQNNICVISALPREMIEEFLPNSNSEIEIIYAFEAIKYLSEECLKNREKFEEVDPEKILSANRIDIIPRYLLAKAIINNSLSIDYYKSLYARSILLWNNADEKVGVFSAKAKKTVDVHVESMKILLSELGNKGFKKDNYIPIDDKSGVLLDGAHRLAAAMALNEKVWVRRVNNKPNPVVFDWFIENGFDFRDQIEILRGYADLHSECGLFVIFSPAIPKWDYIRSQIEQKMTIVGYTDLDFSNNFYAFENLINEIYSTYQGNIAMERKIKLLLMCPLKIRIVLTSSENHESDNLYAWMTQLKLELRDNLTFEIPNEEYVTIHGTDSKEEFETLKEIILSFNNYKQMVRRVTPNYRNVYCERIGKLKVFLKDKGIPLNGVCVVSGSTLEAMGIRTSDDIDCIASSNVRKMLETNSTYKFDDEVEIISAGRMRSSDGSLITDDDIIFDYNNYFIVYGIKFCNIDLVKYQKQYAATVREKDKRDIRLIDIFNDYATYFDYCSELKKQMKNRFPLE